MQLSLAVLNSKQMIRSFSERIFIPIKMMRIGRKERLSLNYVSRCLFGAKTLVTEDAVLMDVAFRFDSRFAIFSTCDTRYLFSSSSV